MRGIFIVEVTNNSETISLSYFEIALFFITTARGALFLSVIF